MSTNEDQKIVIYWSTKKTISLICSILLVPVFLIFIFSATLKTTILNTSYYLDNLKKVDAYNRLIDDGIPSLILNTKILDNKLSDSFAKELAIFVIQKSVDPDWAEEQTEKVVVKVAELLSNSKDNATIDLSSTNKLFNKVSTGLLVFDNMIPNCQETQNISQGQAVSGNCKIKTDLLAIKNQVDKINLGTINLDNYIKNANSFVGSVQHFTNNINSYFWLSFISLIILLGTIIALEIDDLPFMIKAISLSAMVTSIVAFFGALIAKMLISTAYVGVGTDLSGPIKKIIGDFTAICVTGIFTSLEITSSIIFGAFLAFFVATSLVEKSGLKLFKHR